MSIITLSLKTNIKIKVIFTTALIFLFLIAILQEFESIYGQDIKIASNKIIGGIPLFISQNEDLFAEYNITYKTDLFPTASQISQALLSKQYDIGGPISLIDLSIIDSKNPGLFQLFFIAAENHTSPVSHVIVNKDSQIQNLTELEGKKIGIYPGVFFEFFAKTTLEHFNVKNVELITVPPPAASSALAGGKIDAAMVIEPFYTIASASGNFRSIYQGFESVEQSPNPVVGIAFTSQFVKENPELALNIINITDNATKIAKTDRNKTIEALVKYTDIDRKIADMVNLNVLYNSTEIKSVIPMVQKLSDRVYEQGYMDKKINSTNMFYKFN